MRKKDKGNFFTTIFEGKYKHVIFILLLFLILSISFFKIAFRNYVPQASDTMQWRSSAECMIEYNKTHKEQAQWNSNVFSGMPGYLISFGAKYPFINTIKKVTNKIMNWRIFLLFMAALGVYLFMIFLGFEPIIAFISAIGFALSCHFLGLLEIGHNSKFITLIYIPWIFFSIHYLKERKSILAMGLAALLLIGQLRENHPQISYYTFILIGIYWLFNLIWSIKDKKVKDFIYFSLMFLGVLVITVMAVAQPYLSTMEYGNFTIRSGAEGVGQSYATSWSFHPAEMISFIIPNFFGGTSPNYWGWMPFTQTSMYMGVIILVLAIIAIFFDRRRIVKILMATSIVALLMSFGKHLPFLSNFLLKYLPFFNKFRVPAMILILLQFSVVIMAGYGLKSIVRKVKDKEEKFAQLMGRALLIVIILGLIFVASESLFQQLEYSQPGEFSKLKKQYVSAYGRTDGMKYATRHMQKTKDTRHKLLVNDGYIAIGLLILFFALTYAFSKNKLGKYPYLLLIMILVVIDLINVDQRFLQDVYPKKKIDSTYQKTAADKFLLKDKEEFRIYPLAGEFGQNRWAYYHQSIGGYHGAKLERYQEIIENCLNKEVQNRIPINWNIVNMLNAKYVVFNKKLPLENLEYASYDRDQKLTIYKNTSYLPRAWFVDSTELISNKENIWKRLNQRDFDPGKTAIIEKEISGISAPDSSQVILQNYDLHGIEFKVTTDTTSFLNISEIYYPKGWKAYIDGKKTEIYASNYILRGVVIPQGEHILTMQYDSETYNISIILSLLGLILTVLLLIIGAIFYYRENYQGKIVYVMKENVEE